MRWKVLSVIAIVGCTGSLGGVLGGKSSSPSSGQTNDSSQPSSSDSSSSDSASSRPANSSSSSSEEAEEEFKPEATVRKDVAEETAKLNKCGSAINVELDFSKYDERASVAGTHDPLDGVVDDGKLTWSERQLAAVYVAEACKSLVHAVWTHCNAKQHPMLPVQTVRCVFTGHSARLKDESSHEWQARNVTLAKGVFTVHIGPGLGNIEETADLAVAGESWQTGLKNGAKCTARDNCKSSVCQRGACSACRSDADCESGAECDSKGVCFTRHDYSADAPSSSGPSSSGPKQPKGKSLGQSCKSNAECDSKYQCKAVSSSRSTCR